VGGRAAAVVALGCEAEDTAATVVIVLNVWGRVIGVVVDSVSDVLPLAPDQVKAAPEMQTRLGRGAIKGIGCLRVGEADRMLILLDIEALMGSDDIGLVDSALR
jgi:purine-binding chemotaxis protein CheW